ncbi:MAG: SusD/RagB family nutrient-binding outer membrane lipoprotein [Muribaculaceae bacterium]|nr:SusD/RagB family nutrient-binding outer membrane lipoprotein [Muribaculaceae bacterium]
MIKKYIAIALIALTATACSEDLMDRINENKANPAAEIVSGKYIIPGAIMNTAHSTVSGNYAWYISSFTEQEFGTGNNQLKNAEVRNTNEYSASSCFNNEWNATYSTMRSLKEVLDKCEKGGINEGESDLKGMAQVLMALNLGILTDLHGDVPYSEALKGLDNLQPKLDKQEDIYKAIFQLLDDAIDNFAEGVVSVGTSDILFGNDLDQWTGFAYALKARYKLHLSYRNGSSAYEDAIEAANSAIEAGFDGVELDVFDGISTDNPWAAYFLSRYYTGASKTVADLLNARQDPRIEVYALDFFGTGVDFAEPGDAQAAGETYYVGGPAWLDNGAATIHLLSKAELYFILAEAKIRTGKDASEDFATAVEASFEDFENSDPGYTGFSSGLASDYISGLSVTLDEIMVQKYLSQVRDEQIEAYNDIRRCKAQGETFITLKNPKNNSSTGSTWPLRLPYGSSDVLSNPNVSAAFGSGNAAGSYIFTENVWWAGGSR